MLALALEKNHPRTAKIPASIDLTAVAGADPSPLRRDPFTGESLQLVQTRRGYIVASAARHREDVPWINRLTNRDAEDTIAFVLER